MMFHSNSIPQKMQANIVEQYIAEKYFDVIKIKQMKNRGLVIYIAQVALACK